MSFKYKITHDFLVEKARKYLLGKCKCSVVLTELHTSNREIPDVIGWDGYTSYLIECKTSKQDFKNERKKLFRGFSDHPKYKYSELGVGCYRYYLTPKDLLKNMNLPENWGLLELNKERIIKVKEAKYIKHSQNSEIILLISTLRRLNIKEEKGVNIKIYKELDYDAKCNATLTLGVEG